MQGQLEKNKSNTDMKFQHSCIELVKNEKGSSNIAEFNDYIHSGNVVAHQRI